MKRPLTVAAAMAALLLVTACTTPANKDQVGFGAMESNLVFAPDGGPGRPVQNVTFLAASETSGVWEAANVTTEVNGETLSFPITEVRKGDTTPDGIMGAMTIDFRGFDGEITALAIGGSTRQHDIGLVRISVVDGKPGPVKATGDYPVLYPEVRAFHASVRNASSTDVSITAVDLGLSGITTSSLRICGKAVPASTGITLAAGQTCDVDMAAVADTGKFQYFQTNPRISYTQSGNKGTAVLPLVQYRVGSASASDLESMAARRGDV